MIISTGMASVAELDDTVRAAREAGCKDLILLKCTSTYPATAASKAAADPLPPPFALEFVTITKQEHIQLKMAAMQWQTLHCKALSHLTYGTVFGAGFNTISKSN